MESDPVIQFQPFITDLKISLVLLCFSYTLDHFVRYSSSTARQLKYLIIQSDGSNSLCFHM